MPIDLKYHHGGVSVPNLEESIQWFATVLDFKVERRIEIPAIPARVAMLCRDDLRERCSRAVAQRQIRITNRYKRHCR